MPQLNLPKRLAASPLILLVLITLVLQGCFLDDDDPAPVPEPTPNANPAGYYTNTGFIDVMQADNTTPRATITDFQGMASGSSLMMLSDLADLAYVGTIAVTGNDFSGTVDVYEAGVMTQGDVPFSGTITEGTRITGTMRGTNVANGTFQLDYAPALDNGPVTVSMIVPTLDWEPVTNSISYDITAGNDPAPIPNFTSATTGSSFLTNCTLLARMEPISEIHVFALSGPMIDCDFGDTMVPATYSGLASVRGIAPNDRLVVVVSNGVHGVNAEYIRR